jgi:hypothetical protein
VHEPQDLSEATGCVETAFVIWDRRNGEACRMRRQEPKRSRTGWRQDGWRQRPLQHSGVVVSSGEWIPLSPKLLYPPNLKLRPKRPMLSL